MGSSSSTTQQARDNLQQQLQQLNKSTRPGGGTSDVPADPGPTTDATPTTTTTTTVPAPQQPSMTTPSQPTPVMPTPQPGQPKKGLSLTVSSCDLPKNYLVALVIMKWSRDNFVLMLTIQINGFIFQKYRGRGVRCPNSVRDAYKSNLIGVHKGSDIIYGC